MIYVWWINTYANLGRLLIVRRCIDTTKYGNHPINRWFHSLCNFCGSNFNITRVFLCNSNHGCYFALAYVAQGRQRVRSRSPFPRHSMTTVVEFPIERTHPVVCVSYGKPREIPRCGCQRNRHGMTLGMGFWRRYCLGGSNFNTTAIYLRPRTTVLRSRTPWIAPPLLIVNLALTLTMHMARLAALLTTVGVIFMKYSSPKCYFASRKLNSI